MKKVVKYFSLVIIISLLFACGNSEEKYTTNLFYMDTYIKIDVFSKDKALAEELLKEADEIFSYYHKLSDRFDSYDDIINVKYLNDVLGVGETVEIDNKLYDMLEYGKYAYEVTNGYVNIALGNVIDEWKRFRSNERELPTYEELSSKNVNINDIVLEGNTYKKLSNVSIDLGSVAKGYVTEVIGEYFTTKGLDKYIINAGGNVKVGNHYNGDRYKIGLEDPFDKSSVYKVVKGENISVVTSGSYQRYDEIDGIKYHHIINPKTLFPAYSSEAVTVITPSSAYADIISTYLFIIGTDGLSYVNSTEGIEAVWNASGEITSSSGFGSYE